MVVDLLAYEQMVWVFVLDRISAFMVVGASKGGITVGEVESTHRDEVGDE